MDTQTRFVADAVGAAIRASGSSEQRVCEAIGMKPPTLRSRLAGRSQFRMREVLAIADHIGVTADNFAPPGPPTKP